MGNNKAISHKGADINSIVLTRNDLVNREKNMQIKNIQLYDFKSNVISTQEIQVCDYIVFKDLNEVKVLKDRFSLNQK